MKSDHLDDQLAVTGPKCLGGGKRPPRCSPMIKRYIVSSTLRVAPGIRYLMIIDPMRFTEGVLYKVRQILPYGDDKNTKF